LYEGQIDGVPAAGATVEVDARDVVDEEGPAGEVDTRVERVDDVVAQLAEQVPYPG